MRHLPSLAVTAWITGVCAGALPAWGAAPSTRAASDVAQLVPAVEAEVRAQVAAGRTRVLVELRLQGASAPSDRGDAVSRAQDEVLVRLPPGHASVTRRYSSVPLLALEIDAVGLRALEAMGDLVSGVKVDGIARSQ